MVMECWILGERRRVLERRVLEMLRRDGQRQQVKLESPDPLGQLDSTEEVERDLTSVKELVARVKMQGRCWRRRRHSS